MKITLLQIGKTEDKYIIEGIDKYENRLKHYCKYQCTTIPALKNVKNISEEEQRKKEAELIFKNINNNDYVILLDERGKDYSSVQFSEQINKYQVKGLSNVVFIVGGPYGFDESIYKRSNDMLSLSKMTFSHQMVRLFFTEQIYRAYTILKNEPYHHN